MCTNYFKYSIRHNSKTKKGGKQTFLCGTHFLELLYIDINNGHYENITKTVNRLTDVRMDTSMP